MLFPSDHGFAVPMQRCIACGATESPCCDGLGNALPPTCVFQDGADFYRDLGDEQSVHLATFPARILDYDAVGAEKARRWFVDEFCPAHGLRPVFE